MSVSLRVDGMITAEVPAEGSGRVELRLTRVSFMVPLEGGEVGWALDSPQTFRVSEFRFHTPDVRSLIQQARAEGRDEVLAELRELTADEIIDRLATEEEEEEWVI